MCLVEDAQYQSINYFFINLYSVRLKSCCPKAIAIYSMYFLLLFVGIGPTVGTAQTYLTHEYQIKNITGKNYPPVFGVTQDKEGVVWLNGRDKIGYYDGQKIGFLTGIQEQLQAPIISKIFVLERGYLLLLTKDRLSSDAYFEVLHIKSGTVTPMEDFVTGACPISHLQTPHVIPTADGLWIGSRIVIYDYKDRQINRLVSLPDHERVKSFAKGLQNGWVLGKSADFQGRYALYAIGKEGQLLSQLDLPESHPRTLANRCHYVDSTGTLYFSFVIEVV